MNEKELKLECLKASTDALAKTGLYVASRALDEAKTFFGWVSEEAAPVEPMITKKAPSTKPKPKKK